MLTDMWLYFVTWIVVENKMFFRYEMWPVMFKFVLLLI